MQTGSAKLPLIMSLLYNLFLHVYSMNCVNEKEMASDLSSVKTFSVQILSLTFGLFLVFRLPLFACTSCRLTFGSSLTYNRESNTLTCISTGEPATTVTWRRDGVEITLNATHQQTKSLVHPEKGTYQTVLTIDPSVGQQGIVGTYNCTVENVRASMVLVVTG